MSGFSVKRNHVIISALVLMVAVAGYFNFRDGGLVDSDNGMQLTSDGEILALIMDDVGQEVAVISGGWMDTGNIHNTEIAQTFGESVIETSVATNAPGQAVFVNTTNDSSFFIQARLNREQARSSQQSALTEMINNPNISDQIAADTAERLLDIKSRIERETAAEALIEAKGFTEVYVRIGDDSVDVVVDTPQLSEAEIAQIEDVIRRKTGFALDQIFISPLRAGNNSQ